MSRVLLELSVSLDGFAAGPDIGPDARLGRDGERLHVGPRKPRRRSPTCSTPPSARREPSAVDRWSREWRRVSGASGRLAGGGE